MNYAIVDDVANSISKLRMYPYFDISHYILMSIAVKEDTPQSGSIQFSRRHPFSCWLATMLMCFGGAILSSFVCGNPLLLCFDDTLSVFTATAIWYLINYFPFDMLYRLCKLLPFRLLICTLKEVQRAKKIAMGVHHGLHLYPDSVIMCILLGLLKGAGSVNIRPVSQFVLGVWKPKNNPILNINFTTKISLLAAVAYYCHNLDLIPLPANQLFLLVACLFVYLRVTMILLGLKDPFVPFENAFCAILFGGTVDALRNALERSRGRSADSTSTTANTTSTVGSGLAASPSTTSMAGMTNLTGTTNINSPATSGTSPIQPGLRDTVSRQPSTPADKKRD